VRCIKVLGGSGRRYASLGDVFVGVIKVATPTCELFKKVTKKDKKKRVVRCVVVRVRQPVRRDDDGSYVRFDRNAAVIVDKENQPHRHAPFSAPRSARAQGQENSRRFISLAAEVV